jgi:hypothetical protein
VAGVPQVVFPSEAPDLPTGPGAIVWATRAGRCGPPATRSSRPAWRLELAAFDPSERAAIRSTRPLEGEFSGELAAAGASFGRVAVAAGLWGAASPAAAVMQARAGTPLGPPSLSAGSRLALTRAYLGDAAIATVRGSAIAVRVQRHFSKRFGPARLIPIMRGRVSALAATMDYRSDVLVVWQQEGAVYAHMLRASKRADPTQRVGPSAPGPQLQALVSDNDHGMIAWSSTEAPGRSGSRTRTYLDLSAAGVRFGRPRLLASFRDPAAAGALTGSLELVRLSSENVVMAWTDLKNGHYVVRGAPAVFAVGRPAALLSDPHRQGVLAGLAPGRAGEAIALWTSTPHAAADPRAARTELWAARTFVGPHGRLAVLRPEMIAAPGAGAAVSIAVDPANDRAVAAWLAPGASVHYAVSRATSRSAPPLAARAAVGAAGVHWLRIALAAAVALAGLAALVLWRRRRQTGGG